MTDRKYLWLNDIDEEIFVHLPIAFPKSLIVDHCEEIGLNPEKINSLSEQEILQILSNISDHMSLDFCNEDIDCYIDSLLHAAINKELLDIKKNIEQREQREKEELESLDLEERKIIEKIKSTDVRKLSL
jgi:hypothetical protein